MCHVGWSLTVFKCFRKKRGAGSPKHKLEKDTFTNKYNFLLKFLSTAFKLSVRCINITDLKTLKKTV